MLIKIFDKDIAIKEFGCALGSHEPRCIPASVNLFVKVTEGCNAHCLFCSNAGHHTNKSGVFDHDKLWRIVDELQAKDILVNRINITGGEPSTRPDVVGEILSRASLSSYDRIHIHLNTNGLLPQSQELMKHERWNSISISMHHYNIDRLSELYGTKIDSEALQFKGINRSIVNLSCNLIKGYIDSALAVEKMLQAAVEMFIPRLGFVSLMKVNDFCRDRYVDFSDIDFESIPHLYFTQSRNRGANCKCSNYMYNYKGRPLEVYMRNYANPQYCESSLLFDGQYLRQGFHNDNIIY